VVRSLFLIARLLCISSSPRPHDCFRILQEYFSVEVLFFLAGTGSPVSPQRRRSVSSLNEKYQICLLLQFWCCRFSVGELQQQDRVKTLQCLASPCRARNSAPSMSIFMMSTRCKFSRRRTSSRVSTAVRCLNATPCISKGSKRVVTGPLLFRDQENRLRMSSWKLQSAKAGRW